MKGRYSPTKAKTAVRNKRIGSPVRPNRQSAATKFSGPLDRNLQTASLVCAKKSRSMISVFTYYTGVLDKSRMNSLYIALCDSRFAVFFACAKKGGYLLNLVNNLTVFRRKTINIRNTINQFREI